MNRTLFALWAIIFGSILAIVASVFVWTAQREFQARLSLSDLLRVQLEGHNGKLRDLFDDYDRQLQQALDNFDPQTPGSLLALRRHPLVELVVVVSDDGLKGRLLVPKMEQIEPMDLSLIEDALNWIRDNNFTKRDVTNNPAQQATPQPPANTGNASAQVAKINLNSPSSIFTSAANQNGLQVQGFNSFANADSHWTTWYHGRGLVLGYWAEAAGPTVTMVVVPRGRWLSDLVAMLPDNTDPTADRLVQLVDVEGNTITQWGSVSLKSESIVDAELAVGEPLEGWRFRLTLSPDARAKVLGTQNRWLSGLVASGFSLALILLGVMLSTNIRRQLRLAQQQVSFVNQVSHELRTPLTNIRMYTDLALSGLEAHREAGLEGEIERLNIIQQESSRLGRLIENVLTIARSGKPRPLRAVPMASAEPVIDAVMSTFGPNLNESHIQVERVSGTAQPLKIDREALEQILINLVSNAIKYAASGRYLRIETEYSSDSLTMRVTDRGPGIPKRLQQKVFQPFVRGSNRLEDPAGTGIGLSIARQLARQHGGDCWLEPTKQGSTFIAKIRSL